jgi:aryl-alcohol dehydrogenase-like predicted oxidoreductase
MIFEVTVIGGDFAASPARPYHGRRFGNQNSASFHGALRISVAIRQALVVRQSRAWLLARAVRTRKAARPLPREPRRSKRLMTTVSSRRVFLIGSGLLLSGCDREREAPKPSLVTPPSPPPPVQSSERKKAPEPPKGPPADAPKESDIELPTGGKMPVRRLGRTGEKVSLLGLGGFHLGIQDDEKESIRIIRYAIDHGVTFLDNCWDYNEGQSELRMGKALRDGYRKKAFLMTKVDGRTHASATEQLEQSLKRLETDVIDLVQIHEIIRPDDPARCFAKGGTMDALLAAKKAGKLRFIGFTGHKDPKHHVAMLEAGLERDFTFDTVQMPLNVMDAHFKSFEKNVLPLLKQHDVGVLGMKPLGSGIILKSKLVSAKECLHYAMSLPTSVVITGCDSVGVLKQALEAAYSFVPLDEAKVSALLARTAEAAKRGEYELFKTSMQFDGTAKNPHWLESARI